MSNPVPSDPALDSSDGYEIEPIGNSSAGDAQERPSYLQATATKLAYGVGIATLAFMLLLLVMTFWSLPRLPCVISATTQPAELPPEINNYKILSDLVFLRMTTLFDTVVVKVLLPVFLSIVGYIFGVRAAEKSNG